MHMTYILTQFIKWINKYPPLPLYTVVAFPEQLVLPQRTYFTPDSPFPFSPCGPGGPWGPTLPVLPTSPGKHENDEWIIFYSLHYIWIYQGWPGFWGIQYIVVFNFRYTVFLCLKLGITYTVFFLILVFYMSFSIIFGILEGLFPGILVFNYPPGWPWSISTGLHGKYASTLLCLRRELSSCLANRLWHFSQANHGAYSNPDTKLGAQNKDFGAVSQTDLISRV